MLTGHIGKGMELLIGCGSCVMHTATQQCISLNAPNAGKNSYAKESVLQHVWVAWCWHSVYENCYYEYYGVDIAELIHRLYVSITVICLFNCNSRRCIPFKSLAQKQTLLNCFFPSFVGARAMPRILIFVACKFAIELFVLLSTLDKSFFCYLPILSWVDRKTHGLDSSSL